jgi:uncharacterized repeat protein (TIGR03803 family)
MRIVSRGMAITIAALSLAGRAAAAPVEIVLHSFTGSASDGAGPWAGLIADEQGALYGTTYTGGSAGSGTVFKLTPPKGQAVRTETVLYSFQGSASDGGGPVAGSSTRRARCTAQRFTVVTTALSVAVARFSN